MKVADSLDVPKLSPPRRTRRNPGEGGLHWEESRPRWFATIYVGYSPNGKRSQGQGQRPDQDGGEGEAPAAAPRPRPSAEEVHQWLATKAKTTLITNTPHRLLSILRQSIRQKHLAMHAYIVVSSLTGGRTEELRALTWSHTDLDGEPASVQLWRSVREGGDTKTRLSRRTLYKLPDDCVVALRAHRRWQTQSRMRNAEPCPRQRSRLRRGYYVFPLDAANVRRAFRQVAQDAGLRAEEWTPRELRHSFV